jgi:menaquinone-dependent protoporphyrinogen oxidase
MSGRVLVAYGTKRGSTREVAETIGAALRERGLEVDVSPARKIERLERYDCAVVGGALYRGLWHRHARRLLRKNRRLLSEGPLAVFAMGPRRNAEEAFVRSRGQLERALAKLPELQPLSIAVFGGVDRQRGVDLRDWDAIRRWSDELAASFSARAGSVSATDTSATQRG